MLKKSKIDEIATLIGLVFMLIAFLLYINNSRFSVDSMYFYILVPTVIATLFPLMRSVRLNALAYALVTWFILSWFVGTSSLPQLMIVMFVPLSVFFLAGIIEVKGYFLKGIILSWWAFVFYDLHNLGILNGDFISYLGERQFQYASNQYALVLVYALLYKIVVSVTLKPVYVSSILNDTKVQESGLPSKYYVSNKLNNFEKVSIDDTPNDYYTAHSVVQDLYDRGVISKSKLMYYANLKEKDMFNQLLNNKLISEEESSSYQGVRNEKTEVQPTATKSFPENVEINYVDDSIEELIGDMPESSEEDKLKEKRCLQCNHFPCECCQNCFTSPCSCCDICGHPKRWCSCF
jgi:hypothetical protein